MTSPKYYTGESRPIDSPTVHPVAGNMVVHGPPDLYERKHIFDDGSLRVETWVLTLNKGCMIFTITQCNGQLSTTMAYSASVI